MVERQLPNLIFERCRPKSGLIFRASAKRADVKDSAPLRRPYEPTVKGFSETFSVSTSNLQVGNAIHVGRTRHSGGSFGSIGLMTLHSSVGNLNQVHPRILKSGYCGKSGLSADAEFPAESDPMQTCVLRTAATAGPGILLFLCAKEEPCGLRQVSKFKWPHGG